MSNDACVLLNRSHPSLRGSQRVGRSVKGQTLAKKGERHHHMDHTIERGLESPSDVIDATHSNEKSSTEQPFLMTATEGREEQSTADETGSPSGADHEKGDHDGGSSCDEVEDSAKPIALHESLMNEIDMEALEIVQRNRSVLLSRLRESIPSGRLAMVSTCWGRL